MKIVFFILLCIALADNVDQILLKIDNNSFDQSNILQENPNSSFSESDWMNQYMTQLESIPEEHVEGLDTVSVTHADTISHVDVPIVTNISKDNFHQQDESIHLQNEDLSIMAQDNLSKQVDNVHVQDNVALEMHQDESQMGNFLQNTGLENNVLIVSQNDNVFMDDKNSHQDVVINNNEMDQMNHHVVDISQDIGSKSSDIIIENDHAQILQDDNINSVKDKILIVDQDFSHIQQDFNQYDTTNYGSHLMKTPTIMWMRAKYLNDNCDKKLDHITTTPTLTWMRNKYLKGPVHDVIKTNTISTTDSALPTVEPDTPILVQTDLNSDKSETTDIQTTLATDDSKHIDQPVDNKDTGIQNFQSFANDDSTIVSIGSSDDSAQTDLNKNTEETTPGVKVTQVPQYEINMPIVETAKSSESIIKGSTSTIIKDESSKIESNNIPIPVIITSPKNLETRSILNNNSEATTISNASPGLNNNLPDVEPTIITNVHTQPAASNNDNNNLSTTTSNQSFLGLENNNTEKNASNFLSYKSLIPLIIYILLL